MNKIERMASSPLKMKLFMMKQLPMAFLAGLRIVEFNESRARVSVPFKFLNKNPFRSLYFAVLSMAAELSCGIIALAAVSEAKVPVSMLVLKMRAEFTKKARTKITFTCNDGEKIKKTIEKSIETGEGQTIEVHSSGLDSSGDTVAEFIFEWTFKPKGEKQISKE